MQLDYKNIEVFSLEPHQKEVHKKFMRLLGPGIAAFYYDACKLMFNCSEYKTTSHLVAHLFREIESALRDILRSHCDLKKPSNKEDENHKKDIQEILKELGISENQDIWEKWTSLTNKNSRLSFRAHRSNLNSPRTINNEEKEYWRNIEILFDKLLSLFEGKFLKVFEKCDTLLSQENPCKNHVESLNKNLPHSYHVRRYFFQNLSNPKWMKLLKDNQFFKCPPDVIKDEEGNDKLPYWPESEFLSRMAKEAPKEVMEIICEIPDTQNISIHQDLINASLSMPPEIAQAIVPKAKNWLKNPNKILTYEHYGNLISHLAKGKFVDDAIDIAKLLLAIEPKQDNSCDSFPKLQTRIDIWEYQQILVKNIPALVEAGEEKTLQFLCDLLELAVCCSLKPSMNSGSYDLSIIVQPVIEVPRFHDLRNCIITSVYNAFDNLLNKKGKTIFNILETKRYKIFHRIALSLRRKYWEIDPTGTIKILSNPDIYVDNYLDEERNRMLSEHFGKFPPEIHYIYYQIIQKGIKYDTYSNRQKDYNQQANQEDYEKYLRSWQYKKLLVIQNYLYGEWKTLFEKLKAECPMIDPSDIYTGNIKLRFGGLESPKTIEELQIMNQEELIGFLKEYDVSNNDDESMESMSVQLTILVADKPELFADNALRFKELLPVYINGILSGWVQAIEKKSKFQWRMILNLCLWVVNQPRDELLRKGYYSDIDPGWGWTRNKILNLISIGLEENDNIIPFESRKTVWSIISILTDDPDPTAESERNITKGSWSPSNVAINSVRGVAMDCVVKYALWCFRYLKEKSTYPINFQQMPEVEKVLNHHLDLNQETSLAIRSVYGRWLPSLAFLDHDWTRDNVFKIFPTEQNQAKYFNSAWETYIRFCHPDENVFDLISDEYMRSINQLNTASDDEVKRSERDLCDHVLMYYWWGKIDQSFLAQFYMKASPNLCKYAIIVIGEWLQRSREEIDQTIIDRLKALWKWRLEEVQKSSPESDMRLEMFGFGGWFVSGRFENNWAIEQLKKALEISGKVNFDHLVVEKMVELVKEFPMLTMECLRFMIDGDKEGWNIYHWKDKVKIILSIANECSDKDTKNSCISLINSLGAKGHLYLRDLLR